MRRRNTRKTRAFRERYGPAALVTGAAQGIGRAFADSLAARGIDVYLLDVQATEVVRAASEVSAEYGVRAIPMAIDLADRDFLTSVLAALEREAGSGPNADGPARDETEAPPTTPPGVRPGSEIGLVVCNAAIGLEGPFLSETLESLQRSVDVNCQAALALSHHFGREMVERGRGGLLLIASGTALQGSPDYATYAATKAFNLVLGESLWYELKDRGVDVLSFVPGPTNTPGLRSSLPSLAEGVEVGPIRLPGVTAEAAIEALGKRASAARQRDHANRLAARRRAAERLLARRSGAASPGNDSAAD
jgi:short-subunit dehydrogenase